MNGTKDSPIGMVWGGIVAPGAIGVLVLVNLIMWRVYWPAGRGHPFVFHVYHDAWRVVGTVLFKLGIAAGLVSWFTLANLARTEKAAPVALAASVTVTVLGLAIFVIGFFV